MKFNQYLGVKGWLSLSLALLSTASLSAWQNQCSDVKSISTWSTGSDRYGIQFQLDNNGSYCSSGFYLEHEANNKRYVNNILLTSMAIEKRVCIQYNNEESKIDNRCRVNMVILDK